MFGKGRTVVARLKDEVNKAYNERVQLDTRVAVAKFDLSMLMAERDRAVRVFDNLHDLLLKEPRK